MLKGLTLSIAITAAVGASAANWEYTYTTSAGDSGDLFLTTTQQPDGNYFVTDIVGERDGIAITSFDNGGPSASLTPDGLFIYDNILYPSGDPLDVDGLMFQTANGFEYNVYGNPDTEYGAKNGGYTSDNAITSYSVRSVPGPAAIAPFIIGIAGLIRRKRR
jgi:hypothetical protein